MQFFIAFNSPGSTTQLDRGGISGDLTDFSSTNVALRAAKGTEEANELHFDLPDIVASPPLQRTQFFIAFISPGSTHAAG
jgi:hypothetical protein